ncbi:MAG: DNA mismatch repair protein MutS [Treponema sp.]|jgi:DNA mismatch repair protein MutS|nr:DNA mismatch repair protein MutS [Treponema sp.]
MVESTPLLKQYMAIKREHTGNILFFRLGDFYEMFAEDAVEVSALLNLTLTHRNGVPMCGVPHHAANHYIARLLRIGKRVALCEQLSEPGKGLVNRKVVEIISPGTTVEEEFLESGAANYLACICRVSGKLSFAYIDLSTGEFRATAFPFEEVEHRLKEECIRLGIKEVIVPDSLLKLPEVVAVLGNPSIVLNRLEDWLFDLRKSRERLERQFGTVNLKAFGLHENSPEIMAAGMILEYIDKSTQAQLPHIRNLSLYYESEFLGIDESSLKNLELVWNMRENSSEGSLFSVINKTVSAPGRRLLKRRLTHPLMHITLINRRLDMVDMFYRDSALNEKVRAYLKKMPDLDHLISRIALDKAHAKDMVHVRQALLIFFDLINSIAGKDITFESSVIVEVEAAQYEALRAYTQLLIRALEDEPPVVITEGQIIRAQYNKDVDRLRALKENGHKILERYVEEERRKSGIPSLKVHYNRLIGYFFEVTKAYLSRVPAYFISRQEVQAGKRFSTEKLAALESDINGASESLIELERQLFIHIRKSAKDLLGVLTAVAHIIAELDVSQALAWLATEHRYVRPTINDSTHIHIVGGRHPVVESVRGEFVANDCFIDGTLHSFVLITGPNMAGKSTYLRQVALIAVLAQMGSFVPAQEATLGLVDRLYCRVGASDNLSRGESTFLVEMNETAYILNTATQKSLVIMDEVGRGTGAKDGLAIAWAVSEELLNTICCRTLFATHYHELSHIANPRLVNRSMEIAEKDGTVVFLRKLREGATTRSYGIPVARLAGLEKGVLLRAQQILDQLNEKETSNFSIVSAPAAVDVPVEALLKAINQTDPDSLTAFEALTLLYQWKKLAAAVQPT